ncbi:MAG: hypothetical protein WBQ25_21535 [Nitrososphaeraceae archaeon]
MVNVNSDPMKIYSLIYSIVSATIAGIQGYKVLYTDKIGYDIVEIWIVTRGNAYTIKYLTKPEDRSLYFSIFQKMINSFKLVK